MSELEQIRIRLHDALRADLPREEILLVSRRLDVLILTDMKARAARHAAMVQAE